MGIRRWMAPLAACVLLLGACTSTSGDDEEIASVPTTAAPVTTTAGAVEVSAPADEECSPGELCVTVTADEFVGKELRLMLYPAAADDWPHRFRMLPTPGWVVNQSRPA